MQNTETFFFTYKNENLHYHCTGTGKQILLTFHGYGLDAKSFSVLYPVLKYQYKIISVDLPHHGDSVWGNTIFTKELLINFITHILHKFDEDKFSVIGYSLGGRVCLNLIELIPDKIDRAVLLAPDGLDFNFAYYLATKNNFGKKIFKSIINNPTAFFKMANLLLKLKVLDTSRHKFVTHYLLTEKARSFLYNVWACMADILPNIKKVKNNINKYNIPVFIIMGEYDRIIPTYKGRKFIKNLHTAKLQVLKKGHNLLDQTTIKYISENLL